jgi:acyl dehydratase
MSQRYLEDFTIGDRFETERYTITRESALEFAELYDPQPFHLDDEAAAKSFFGRLVVSGWQTAAVTMRLIVKSGLMGAGIVGAGVEELRWLAPVAPGETLFVRGEVMETLPHPSGQPRGYVTFRMETFRDDDGAVVMSQFTKCAVPLRP